MERFRDKIGKVCNKQKLGGLFEVTIPVFSHEVEIQELW